MKSELAFGLENASWPALLVDGSAVIRKVSQGARAVFGPGIENSPTLAASIWGKENEATPEQFFARWSQHPTGTAVWKLRLKDGSNAPFTAYINTLGGEGQEFFVVQCLRLDGSVDPGANTTVMHKQKLDCALQLSRTVALDFNNALTSILGHASLVLGRMEGGHPWRSSMVEIEKSAEKAAEIAHDLAAFSRQDKDAKTHQAGNLNDLLRRTTELFKTPAASGVFWTLQFESKLYTANFDEAKMQQAFVKVFENAMQAIGASGRIVVTTLNHDFEEPFRDGAVQVAAGRHVSVEITDSGCGIPAESLPRVFEPFFTTKNSPQHRGLGLAWVYGIVTNHGGCVAISSEVGRGTSVRIYLPALKKVVRDTSAKYGDLTGTQTILMIDDEELLLTMGEMVLSSYGYRVLTANSGRKGLELFQRCAREIDLVITDLVMPQMSGRELMEQLRKLCPEVKIICSSGFVRSGSDDEETYLQKPFTSQDLLRKVKQALSVH